MLQQCRESQLHQYEKHGSFYEPIIAVLWSVQEAYVFCVDGYIENKEYLLIDENRIIELGLPEKPIEEQMKGIGEKLFCSFE